MIQLSQIMKGYTGYQNSKIFITNVIKTLHQEIFIIFSSESPKIHGLVDIETEIAT
jgi:hypothetical protein